MILESSKLEGVDKIIKNCIQLKSGSNKLTDELARAFQEHNGVKVFWLWYSHPYAAWG